MTEFSSPSITNLAKALLSAQEQLRPVAKDATNPFLRNRYASLPAVLDVVRRPLLDNGILLIQRVVASEPGTIAVETRLIHAESGEWVAGTICIPLPEPEPGNRVNLGQQTGASLSYGRRYSLMSMLSLAAVDEDTDNEIRTQPLRRFQPPPGVQRVETSAPAQARGASGMARSDFPGLPVIPDVVYEESRDTEGRHIVIAKGATLPNKDSLRQAGFHWDVSRKAWWIAA